LGQSSRSTSLTSCGIYDGRAGINLTQELHHAQAIRIEFYIEPFGSDSSGPLSLNDSKFIDK
jgi:hypothetical protein